VIGFIIFNQRAAGSSPAGKVLYEENDLIEFMKKESF